MENLTEYVCYFSNTVPIKNIKALLTTSFIEEYISKLALEKYDSNIIKTNEKAEGVTDNLRCGDLKTSKNKYIDVKAHSSKYKSISLKPSVVEKTDYLLTILPIEEKLSIILVKVNDELKSKLITKTKDSEVFYVLQDKDSIPLSKLTIELSEELTESYNKLMEAYKKIPELFGTKEEIADIILESIGPIFENEFNKIPKIKFV